MKYLDATEMQNEIEQLRKRVKKLEEELKRKEPKRTRANRAGYPGSAYDLSRRRPCRGMKYGVPM